METPPLLPTREQLIHALYEAAEFEHNLISSRSARAVLTRSAAISESTAKRLAIAPRSAAAAFQKTSRSAMAHIMT
jgi:hypothetical protein